MGGGGGLRLEDDLKMFAKNKNEIDSLATTVQVICQDIGMQFGAKKCGVTIMKRGKLVNSEDVRLLNGKKYQGDW